MLLADLIASFLAVLAFEVASDDAVLIASDFLVSAYDLAEFKVEVTFVSTYYLVS